MIGILSRIEICKESVEKCTQRKCLPENHIGVVKLRCNCSRRYGKEFCLFCGKEDVMGELKEMLPIKKKRVERLLKDAELTSYSVRRTAAMFVRCMIEELQEMNKSVHQETVNTVDTRIKYVFCWSRKSEMYNSYTEGWYNYNINNLIPMMALVNFIWRETETWPVERMWPPTSSILTNAAKVNLREKIVEEARSTGRLAIEDIKQEGDSVMQKIFQDTTGIKKKVRVKTRKLPSAQDIMEGKIRKRRRKKRVKRKNAKTTDDENSSSR